MHCHPGETKSLKATAILADYCGVREMPGQAVSLNSDTLNAGKPDDEDLERIRTRKPEQPMIEVTLEDGSKRQLWCTFGPQQIDLDPFSPSGAPLIARRHTKAAVGF